MTMLEQMAVGAVKPGNMSKQEQHLLLPAASLLSALPLGERFQAAACASLPSVSGALLILGE